MPFKVPVFDETASLLQEQAYKKAKKEQPTRTFTEPKPIYWWAYRPELQFSVYELAVEEIRREDGKQYDGQGGEDILGSENPVVNSTDDFLKILYQLQSNENDALGGYSFDGDKELIFALGEQELRATVTQGAGGNNILTFDDLSSLTALGSEDFLSMRLYLNNDTANVLWEWAFGSELVVITSADEESNDELSFLICSESDAAKGACQKQQKIVAWIDSDYPDDTKVTWRVEALPGSGCDEKGENCPPDDLLGESNGGSGATNKPLAYGKIRDVSVGGHEGFYTVAQTASGAGEFKKPWVSVQGLMKDLRYLTFYPDIEAHKTSTYRSSACSTQFGYCLSGTNLTDVWRHNPHVSYKITATMEGQRPFTKTIKMDEIDVLRQEYINHLSSAADAAGKKVKIPDRSDIVAVPPGDWVDRKGRGAVKADGSPRNPWAYSYGVMVDESMSSMLSEVTATLDANLLTPMELDDGTEITWPAGASIRVTSGYRNPERNERVSIATASRHMLGRALDIAIENVSGTEKAKAYYMLWTVLMANKPTNADWIVYEDKPAHWFRRVYRTGGDNWTDVLTRSPWSDVDENEDGIPDAFNLVTHVHLQDDP